LQIRVLRIVEGKEEKKEEKIYTVYIIGKQ
jgi:hypothetical protein